MQHLSELTKTRLEMDKLEQQQTLLQMQKDLKRRQEEHEKDVFGYAEGAKGSTARANTQGAETGLQVRYIYV